MKTLCLLLFGSLLFSQAWAIQCPSNFEDFSGKIKDINPKRPLFKLLKNDVRDGYEPGQEITLSLHSLVASGPMNSYLVTAKSIDGRCGHGKMMAQKSPAKIVPGCSNALESGSKEEWTSEVVFGYKAPECGCVVIKATVVAAMDDIAYVDAAGVFEGPLTMTLCPRLAGISQTKPKIEKVEVIAEYKPSTVDAKPTTHVLDKEAESTKNMTRTDGLLGHVKDNNGVGKDDDDDFVDDLEDVLTADLDKDVKDDFEEDSSEFYDDFDSDEDSEEWLQKPVVRRPWRRPFVKPQWRPRKAGQRMPRRRPHRPFPRRRPHGRQFPPRRRPAFNNNNYKPPKSPLGARLKAIFKATWPKKMPNMFQRNSDPKRFQSIPLPLPLKMALAQRKGFQGRRFSLLTGKKNPLGLVRHHLMGPSNFLIDSLCTKIEQILDNTKDEDTTPFHIPHFFGCPDPSGKAMPTYRKRGPPGFQQDQAKRFGRFDDAEIKKKWDKTKRHTKMCCGKTGKVRYACIRRQRMDVVCAPDFQVPLCNNPSTTLVRWKIGEARKKCCPLTGVERYDCFNRTSHPIAGHPLLNRRFNGQPMFKDLTEQPKQTTPTPSIEAEPTVRAVIPDEDSWEDSDEATKDTWVEAHLTSDQQDIDKDDWPKKVVKPTNAGIGTYSYQTKQTNRRIKQMKKELAPTAGDTADDKQMKEDFIENIAKPVWRKAGLGQEDPSGEDSYEEDLDDDIDEIEDAIEEEELTRRRVGHRRPRRRLMERCCLAGRKALSNANLHGWPTCLAKSKTIGSSLHGFARRKCQAVFRRCCVRSLTDPQDKGIVRSTKVQLKPAVIQKVPNHMIETARKHKKTEWKPRLSKPRIRILEEIKE